MTVSASVEAAYRSIWLVERTASAIALTSARHSGCAITTAPGFSFFAARTCSRVTWSWIGQQPFHSTISTSGSLDAIHAPRLRSGPNSTFGTPSDSTTATAFAEVQQTSVSALTSAEVFTYITTGTPGYSAFHAASFGAVIVSDMGQPASGRGMITVFSGARILAVSAMNRTPASKITDASDSAARRARTRESPTTSATACTS